MNEHVTSQRRERAGAENGQTRPLQGRSAWLITDGKRGMDVQAIGVADALGLDYALKHVAPRPPFSWTAPWGPVSPRERLGRPGSLFAPPWPDIAISTGRQSVPYMRALARLAGPRLFRVVLQDPKTGPGIADLIWVPAHDRRRGPNVITTPTAPHSLGPERLAEMRRAVPDAIASLPTPRVAVMLGGPNGVYRFTDQVLRRLATALESLAAHVGSFMITPSRRTPASLLDAADQATRAAPRLLWDGTGENPYPAFLAHADLLIVTADSVNMTGEAAATGRPVYVLEPEGGSAKFARFHEALRSHGATRPLPERITRLDHWTYEPLDSARDIAAEITRRWARRHAMLPGGWPEG